MHTQKAGDDMTIVESGPCWACDGAAMERCDAPGCDRWLCYDHAAVEAQAWDVAGWDGVDVRCDDHMEARYGTTHGSACAPHSHAGADQATQS